MAMTTYAGLKATVAEWLKRSDMTTQIPDFITLGEARIARDLRLRRQVVTTTLSTVAGTQSVALPTDWLETENISVTSGVVYPLSVITPEQMDRKFPEATNTGVPQVYAVMGANLLLGPTPDAVYSISLDYYQRFAALSADGDTNWLLTNHPAIYLFAALSEAMPFTLDDARTQLFDGKYSATAKALQDSDDIALHSGSQMRVRTL